MTEEWSRETWASIALASACAVAPEDAEQDDWPPLAVRARTLARFVGREEPAALDDALRAARRCLEDRRTVDGPGPPFNFAQGVVLLSEAVRQLGG